MIEDIGSRMDPKFIDYCQFFFGLIFLISKIKSKIFLNIDYLSEFH